MGADGVDDGDLPGTGGGGGRLISLDPGIGGALFPPIYGLFDGKGGGLRIGAEETFSRLLDTVTGVVRTGNFGELAISGMDGDRPGRAGGA